MELWGTFKELPNGRIGAHVETCCTNEADRLSKCQCLFLTYSSIYIFFTTTKYICRIKKVAPLKTDSRPRCQGQLPHRSLNVGKSSWCGLGAFASAFWSLCCHKVLCRFQKEKTGTPTQPQNP